MSQKLLCIGTTPAAQRVMVFNKLKVDSVNRAVLTLNGSAGKSVNVAKVLRALGESPIATGLLGGLNGQTIRADLQARGIEHQFVEVPVPTRQCVTVIDLDRQQQTELVEESPAVDPGAIQQLLSLVPTLIPKCRAMIMSGTIVSGAPPTFYRECVSLAHNAGALSVVDAQGAPLLEALAAKPGLVKPNRSELASSVNRPINSESEVIDAMREMNGRGAQRVVVTNGSNSTLAFDGQTFWRISTPLIQARNPIGSGDAFTAALSARLARGDSLGEACRWGTAAGAANALTYMPGELELRQVMALLDIISCQELR